MKYFSKIILSTLGLLLIISGCDTERLHELNLNPQSLNSVDMNYLFTETELGIASGGTYGDDRYVDWRTGIIFCSSVIQQFATDGGGQYAAGDKYMDNQEVYHAPWRWWYSDVMKNTTEIIKQLSPGGFADGQKKNTREAARIIMAFSHARLTDFYGAIPYSNSYPDQFTDGGNKGLEGNFFPVYSKQSVVYADILKELDEAAGAISSSNPDEGFANADFIYNGDITKWKKWAYSLMLRYAMRASNVDATLAATYVAKARAGGVFTSNADNCIVPQADGPGEWTNQNGISRAMFPGDGGDSRPFSNTFISWLKGTNQASVADDDPRLMILSGGIFDWNADGTATGNKIIVPAGTDNLLNPALDGSDPLNQRGMPNGHDGLQLQSILGLPPGYIVNHTFSRTNPKMLYDAAPYIIMNAAEVEFLQAEACERNIGGYAAADAQSHYDAGVKNAMQQYVIFDASLAVSDAAVTAYLTTYPYQASGGVGGGKTKLEQIGEQVWACHFFNWFEAWNNWKRTGFPVLTPTNYVGNRTGGTIPRRLLYPTDEVAGNPNYKTTATTPDALTTKVWWDGGTE